MLFVVPFSLFSTVSNSPLLTHCIAGDGEKCVLMYTNKYSIWEDCSKIPAQVVLTYVDDQHGPHNLGVAWRRQWCTSSYVIYAATTGFFSRRPASSVRNRTGSPYSGTGLVPYRLTQSFLTFLTSFSLLVALQRQTFLQPKMSSLLLTLLCGSAWKYSC
jgi:hypothetical protein